MVRRIPLILLAVPLLATLAGCVAYEPGYRHSAYRSGGYYAPAPVYVSPAPQYRGYGGDGYQRHHRHRPHRGW